MKKETKFKILLGLFYLVILTTFLCFLFYNFNFSEITSHKFIQSHNEKLHLLKDNNLIILSFVFFVFTVFWVTLLGFGSPIAIIGGFVFGKWIGTLLTVLGLTTGSLCLYLFGKYFFYDFLKKNFLHKFKKLDLMFKKREFLIMVVFRFVGLVPFFLANLLPVIFNIKLKNYYFGTLIGILPAVFIMVSLGSGFSDAIYYFDNVPTFFSLIILPEIYLPIIGFIILFVFSILVKNSLMKVK